jgi:hypothetical protein
MLDTVIDVLVEIDDIQDEGGSRFKWREAEAQAEVDAARVRARQKDDNAELGSLSSRQAAKAARTQMVVKAKEV